MNDQAEHYQAGPFPGFESMSCETCGLPCGQRRVGSGLVTLACYRCETSIVRLVDAGFSRGQAERLHRDALHIPRIEIGAVIYHRLK